MRTEYELLQRVYINNDFGAQYIDLSIGTAPIPGTAGTPNPSDLNVIWFEGFTKFSLLEAPVVNGHLTVGNEVAARSRQVGGFVRTQDRSQVTPRTLRNT